MNFLALLLLASQSVSKPAEDNSPAAELKSFTVTDGYAVNLFADESMGIANPVAMRWDSDGRLWVLCTWVYPQRMPGAPPRDKLFILEDGNGDGRADKVATFADDLDMPTGFAFGDGGVYVGEGRDLVHLSDADGDGRADAREVIFTGFGTGDTHQNINSFTWSPGGELLFGQGLHTFSRVETPWGIVRMDEHGIWRMRPRRRQLHAFRGCSGQNPWGVAFGKWGEPFAKGNNTEVSELLPVMVHTPERHRPLDIGKTLSKSMIITLVDSPHLPSDLQGDMLIAGYFARMVDRLDLFPDGSGHRAPAKPPLLRSTHRSFRPVDMNIGPDGAVYLADWYNPIIGHYQASLRHPDRDKTHGRVWRITAVGRPLAKAPKMGALEAAEACALLGHEWTYVREQARRRLYDLPTSEVVAAVKAWLSKRSDDPSLFEAVAVLESHEHVDRELAVRLLDAKEPRARAYAARVIGRWHDRIDAPLELLSRAATDAHPRVRLDAIVACSEVKAPGALAVAAMATRGAMDRFLTAAFTQTVHALKPHFDPAVFDRPGDLASVFRALRGGGTVSHLRDLIASGELPSEVTRSLKVVLGEIGSPKDLAGLMVDDPVLLEAVLRAHRVRGIKPSGDLDALLRPLLHRPEAVTLAGAWRRLSLMPEIRNLPLSPVTVDALGRLGVETETMVAWTSTDQPAEIRAAAVAALCMRDLNRACTSVAGLLPFATSQDEVDGILVPILERDNGAETLARVLKPLSKDNVDRVMRTMNDRGRSDLALLRKLGVTVGIPAYSEALIAEIAGEVRSKGDSARGRAVYEKALCASCHAIDGQGRQVGPELTAVGSGLSVEVIIESVLWPRKQVKEGFISTRVRTKDGRMLDGFVHREDAAVLWLRDPASGTVTPVRKKEISARKGGGTLMPDGIVAGLKRDELRDLVRYLTGRKAR